MRHASWVLAYHGCNSDVAEILLDGSSEIRTSANDYDWLGRGAYFWENSPVRALQWAALLARTSKLSPSNAVAPAVVGAIIDPGNCLDLAEAECLEILKAASDDFSRMAENAGSPLPVNGPGFPGDSDMVKRKLDCAVVNFLHCLREENGELPFDTVRCPFFEGQPLYKNARIAARTHIQWCVRNPRKSIIGYFRPRQPIV